MIFSTREEIRIIRGILMNFNTKFKIFFCLFSEFDLGSG